MNTAWSTLFTAWKKLIAAYLLSALVGFAVGMLLVEWGGFQPERIFAVSTKRLALALPVFERGSRYGVDLGLLLLMWNALGALATISFIYTATLFDPDRRQTPPRRLRRVFGGRSPMKLFCYLPGCAGIDAEPLRRLYVWVMVPMLGLVLLGLESGVQVSTTTFLSGAFVSALITLLPHGLIEIPAFALAGAVPYSAHLLVAAIAYDTPPGAVFRRIETHRRALPIARIALCVIGALLMAGLIEAHVTPRLMQML